MPAPSKFTRKRTALIVAAVSVGASRRTAATLAGIDHATLHRWLEFGERAAPGGRWRKFFEAVQDAESHPRLAVFPDVEDEPNVSEAWRFLERSEFRPDPAGISSVTVTFHDGTPIT
jgi:hypothetical protein